MRKLLLAAVVAASVIAAPSANAQVVNCQVTGVMVVLALGGPVTICSIDTSTADPVELGPLNVSPQHLFEPAPPPPAPDE
jgi:hypothetical protein